MHIYKSYYQSKAEKSQFKIFAEHEGKQTTNYSIEKKTIMTINFDWKLIYSLKNINENVNIYSTKYHLIGK